jgi:uncharacterized protein (DUF2267 family)
MSDERALAAQAQQALDTVGQTLEFIQNKALRELLSTTPDQKDVIDRLIAKAQVAKEVLDVLKRTVAAGEMARVREALDEQGLDAG